ncbi:hypothetical protein FZ043_01840 [Escherichia coli]|nr:hypothetical protein FZ043_01840 [Escherichia coli]
MSHQLPCVTNFLSIISDEAGNSKGVRMIGYIGEETLWICPYISRHLLSLNPLQARCRRYSRGER